MIASPANATEMIDWLLGKCRIGQGTGPLIEDFCVRLVELGVPLWRLSYVVKTLHPLQRIAVFLWHADRPGIEERRPGHGTERTDTYLASPIRRIFDGEGEIRRRLVGSRVRLDFPILEDLAREGVTDYLVLPVPFANGDNNALTFATRDKGGFAKSDLALLRQAAGALAALLEVREVRSLAATLLETYLGKEAGSRVLSGAITRGSGETLDAVIWFSDMRGFTRLSQELPRDELIGLLNEHFEMVGAAIAAEGGEILKFIGDAVLAIFPHQERANLGQACQRALAAARQALAATLARNVLREAKGQPPIRFGVALHVGEVSYGNIGTPSRLDFTVIGPAVNLASRLQSAAADLGQDLVASSDFAATAGVPRVFLGLHALKGITAPVPIYGLPAEAQPAG